MAPAPTSMPMEMYTLVHWKVVNGTARAPTTGLTDACTSENVSITKVMARARSSTPTEKSTLENGRMAKRMVRAPTSGPTEMSILEHGRMTNRMARARTSTQATAMSVQGNGNTGNDAASFLLPTSKIDDPEQDFLEKERVCSICLKDFRQGDERTSLPCKHGFHTDCVKTWFLTMSSCPMCRSRVC